MQVLVNLRFSDGDFEHGFDKTNLSASIAGSKNSTELQTQLPAAPRIPELYQSWQNKYSELVETRVRKIVTEELVTSGFYTEDFSRGFSKQQPTNFSYYECQQNCNQYAEDLRTQINQWLVVIKSRLETEFKLDANSEILLTINTENITSRVTKDILHRLPWQEWDYFDRNSTFEAVLCLSEFQSNSPSVVDSGIFRRVRITSIFGDSTDIDVDGDRQLIAKLQKRGAELINLEQPQRQDFIKLWDEPCDILFYSGHSESSINGTAGSLQINSEENLNLQEIRNTFQEAIRKGLKLAIFNSCDGLGLAKQLADLHLPYIIVWREPVPDKIAIRFLEYFLSSYSEGKSLFKSVRDARIKLVELSNRHEKEKQIPGLEWLPIICKNTTYAAPTWEDLGGLTGKLPDCPYQGLSAFGEEDKEFFFGRDNVIADLVEAVNNKPLVPVIGASGSGKSSVVFAGLVPQLRNIGNVQIVSFRPGKNPFDALAIALKKVQNLESVNSRLKELELGVNLEHNKKALCDWIEEKGQNPRFIVIADQFEELYTLTEDSLRQSFLDLLLYTVQNAPLFSLVLTLRADFMGKFLDYQPMGEAFQKYPPVLLTPMKREDLQAAIEQPAAKLKVELEQGLTSKLIDDLGNQSGRLPLLEFTLSLLWDKHDKWYLTHRAYAEIGGLEKALAKYADGVLNPLSAVNKEKAERIFIQLISPGEGTEDTKRKATRGEVGEDNWGLVEELANHRLVVTGWDESSQQETVEIIHEALIREWGILREWIKSNRRFRVWQKRLQFEVVKWEDNKYNSDYLLSGGGLGEAEVWLNDEKYRKYLSDSQRKFIRESLNQRDKKIKEEKFKQRRTIFRLAGLSIVSLIFAGFAGWNWVKAEIIATREKLNSSVIISEKYFNLQNYQEALLEALKAQQSLDNTWFRSFIKADTKQKIQMSIYKPINNYWLEEKYTLSGHKQVINNLVFSPDGKIIASASANGKVKLWSAINGKLLHTLLDNKSNINSLVFSGVSVATPKEFGKTIVSASDNGIVKLWSASSGQLLKTLSINQSSINSLDLSNDGKKIVSADDTGIIKLWSASNGKLLKTLSGHKSSANSVKFSHDDKQIVSADDAGIIKLWSTSNGKLLKTLSGHKSSVNSIEFSNDGEKIVSADDAGIIKLWSASSGQLLYSLSGHRDSVNRVDFSADGKIIASTSKDGTVKLWSASNGQLLYSLSGFNFAFSSDGNTIASVSKDNKIKLWSFENDELVQSLSGHQDSVVSAIFSPDGKIIASASNDKAIKIWSAHNGELLHTLSGHQDAVYSIRFTKDSKTIASASGDRKVKIWSANTGKLLHTLSDHKELVYSLDISHDGKTIASASRDKTVKLWSTNSGKLIHTLSGDKEEILDVKFSPDGEKIASASGDGTIKLWSVSSGTLINNLSGHEFWVDSIQFSPDGKIIASASADETVKLWSVNSGKSLHTLSGHQDAVYNVQISPDGKIIASASRDETVKLWSANSGKLLYNLPGHKSEVKSIKFSPDGKTIVSTSADKTVKLWSTSSGQLLHTLSGHESDVNSAIFSADGKTIISASDDGTVKLWNWNFDNLLTRGCSKLKGYFINHPEKLEEIKTCQNREILARAAFSLVKQGEKLAKDGDLEGAVNKFRKANKWNPELNINSEVRAKAIILITQARELASEGEIKEAITAYNQAIKIVPKLPVSVQHWNELCWYGSLHKSSTEVMFACEKAVALKPLDENIIDSRGLARALTGDYKGAIEDFEVFVKQTDDKKEKLKRQAWIEDLRGGKNPFTPQVIEELR
ncbi:MAG: hypothetical protein KI793_23805 [Rivularia sp. (in: Bacteria)]|nr:hypothetical protein [Rivularia sp. MS3]